MVKQRSRDTWELPRAPSSGSLQVSIKQQCPLQTADGPSSSSITDPGQVMKQCTSEIPLAHDLWRALQGLCGSDRAGEPPEAALRTSRGRDTQEGGTWSWTVRADNGKCL